MVADELALVGERDARRSAGAARPSGGRGPRRARGRSVDSPRAVGAGAAQRGDAPRRERVVEELVEDREWERRDVCSERRRVEDVDRVLDSLDADLRLEPVVVVDPDDGLDDVHADLSRVVELADGRGDVGAARTRGEEGLRGREDEADVRRDLLVAEEAHDAQPLPRHRDAEDDVLAVLVKLAGFLVHRLRIARREGRDDRAVADLREIGQEAAGVAPLHFRGLGPQQDPVQEAPVAHPAGLFGVGGVEEETHRTAEFTRPLVYVTRSRRVALELLVSVPEARELGELRHRDDAVPVREVDELDAHRRAARLAHVRDREPDEDPLLGDQEKVIGFRHGRDADDRAVLLGDLDVDDARPAAPLVAVLGDVRPLAVALLGDRQERSRLLDEVHLDDDVVAPELDALDARRVPPHRPDVRLGELDPHAVPRAEEDLSRPVGDLRREELVALLESLIAMIPFSRGLPYAERTVFLTRPRSASRRGGNGRRGTSASSPSRRGARPPRGREGSRAPCRASRGRGTARRRP